MTVQYTCRNGRQVHRLAHGTVRREYRPRTRQKGSRSLAQVEQLSGIPVRDEQLIEAVAQGDRTALETIYDRHAPMIFGLALKMLRDHKLAEEVVQEVFWRVWQRAASFDHTRSFAPWLFSIAHNLCIDKVRRQRAQPPSVNQDNKHQALNSSFDDTDVGELAPHAEHRHDVVHAFYQLPIEQRQALTLAYFGNHTQQEIADRSGTPLDTVKTRMRLGLQTLRTILQGQEVIKA